MTYEESKHYFYAFKDFDTAHGANSYLLMRGSMLRKEQRVALRFYMAGFGCLVKNGRFEQYWEADLVTKEIRKAKIRLDGYISEKSIIRQSGKEYLPAYDEDWVLKAITGES